MNSEAWSSAEPYERFMGRWSRSLSAAVMSRLQPSDGLRWVDVGCGTGALSSAILTGASPRSLVAVDPSPSYASAARSRLDASRSNVILGRAEALPLTADWADEVVSGLVLNFTSDPTAAVHEMRRVLKPGARATAYVWDYSDGMQMLHRFWKAAIAEDPKAADLDEGVRFPICRPGQLAACFRAAGLAEVEEGRISIPTTFTSMDDYWLPFLGGQGPAPLYLATLSAAAITRLRDRLEAGLPTAADGSIHLTATALVATGRSH